MKVVTYQSPNNQRIDLTPTQIERLESSGRWPKDSRGAEYCQVSHGLHEVGEPNYGDPEIEAEIQSLIR